MFTIKRPVIVIMLIMVLVATGYINHNLTKRAASRVSNEYQEYEESELAKETQSENDLVEAISEEKEDDLEIIDSEDEKENGSKSNSIDEIVQNTEGSISETISNQNNMKSKSYFIEQRLSRDKLRAGLIDRLNEIVNNENSSQEMITEAQKKIVEIGDLSETELVIEGLIKAKGFNEALVFLTETDAKVVVDVEELTQQDVVKILDIVINETDLDASNVKIMKKN